MNPKTLLLGLAVLGLALVALPATVDAHAGYCSPGDMGCWTRCTLAHASAPAALPHTCQFSGIPP